jgi:hypothetical protein
MRRIRNRVAHGPCFSIQPYDAALYAAVSLHFIGLLAVADEFGPGHERLDVA